ncbi:MAG: pepsin/retropepsin-like aspartic protease family protein [Acidimicrobiales bacterium]
MPAITWAIPSLELTGPTLDISVSQHGTLLHWATNQNVAVPSPIDLLALVDTGSSGSVVQQGVPARLGLQPVGQQKMVTPSTQSVGGQLQTTTCLQYAMRFTIPNGPETIWWDGLVVEAPLQGQNIGALIGRDLLNQFVLIYMGHMNQYTLAR